MEAGRPGLCPAAIHGGSRGLKYAHACVRKQCYKPLSCGELPHDVKVIPPVVLSPALNPPGFLIGETMSLLTVRHDVYVHLEMDTHQLDRVEAALSTLINQGKIMSKELDDLQAQVEANTSVDQSAIALLNGLSAQITALKNDPVKLQAFADSLRNSSADLSAAVTANTPAA